MAGATFSNLNPASQEFYDKTLLKRLTPKLVFLEHGQKRPVSKNSGDTVNFRRYSSLEPVTDALVEGVTPAGNNISVSEITATIEGFGDYVIHTDKLDLAGIDPVVTETVEVLGEQAAESLDVAVRDVVAAGTNVYRVNGRNNRSDVESGDILDGETMRRIRRLMARNDVKPVDGKNYLAFIHPDAVFDLMGDSAWTNANQYAGSTKIFEGEIGKMYGVRYIETTMAPIWEDAGSGDEDVYGTIVIGKDAYGVPDIAGSSKPKTYVKPLGSAGAGDPLDQRGAVGWKAYLATARLQELAILRVEHAVSS